MEIAVTVPYEIKINAEGINLDTFECNFSIISDDVTYTVPLTQKDDYYILKLPKTLAFLNGNTLKYEISVQKDNAIFVASEGEATVLGITPGQFEVTFKPQGDKTKIEKNNDKKKEKKEPEKKASSDKDTKPEKKTSVKEEHAPEEKTPIIEESAKKDTNASPVQHPKDIPVANKTDERKFSFINSLGKNKQPKKSQKVTESKNESKSLAEYYKDLL